MKKKLLSIAFIGICAVASAQSSFQFLDNYNLDITGMTMSYWVTSTSPDSRVFTVNNISESNLPVKVRKTVLQYNDPGATFWFCTDQNCYSPTLVLTSQFTMASNGSFALTTDFDPYGATGLARVLYTVIDQSNLADSASIEIDYNISSSPTGVATATAVKATVSSPMPNPANDLVTFNYNLGSSNPANAKIVIYNTLGSAVMESKVYEASGVAKMNVSDLDGGIYFCSLEVDGKAISTKRMIISH